MYFSEHFQKKVFQSQGTNLPTPLLREKTPPTYNPKMAVEDFFIFKM